MVSSRLPSILIVDDIPSNITVLGGILEDEYKISIATNGEDALKLVAAAPPEMILLDISMPGIDGFEVCRILQDDVATREIPIIFVTAHDSPQEEVRGLSLGAVDFISKPLNAPVVKARIKTHLELYNSRLNSRLLKAKEHRLELDRKTNALTRSLLDPTPVSDKFNTIVRFAVEHYGVDTCRIWAFRPKEVTDSGCSFAPGGKIRERCQQTNCCVYLKADFHQESPFGEELPRIPLGHDQLELIINQPGEWFVSNDIPNDPKFRTHGWATDLGLISFAGFRLRNRQGIMIGGMASFSRHPLDEEKIACLSQLATLASQVITYAQDREKIEHALEQAQAANRSKSAFLATMSHELRTPLNMVIGLSSMLEETELTKKQQEYIEKILKASNILLSVINNILDFSKFEAKKMRLENVPFSPGEIVEEICALLAHSALAKGLKFTCHVAPNIPDQLLGDSDRLQQLLLNLGSNAIKFTTIGEVVVSVEMIDEAKAQDTILLHFTVADTGIGIPEHLRESIFDPFQQSEEVLTRRFGGTGLGLAICRQIANLMNGRLWIESGKSEGSIFHFSCPFRKHSGTTGGEKFSQNRRDLPSIQILMTDDHSTEQSASPSLPHQENEMANAINRQEVEERFVLAQKKMADQSICLTSDPDPATLEKRSKFFQEGERLFNALQAAVETGNPVHIELHAQELRQTAKAIGAVRLHHQALEMIILARKDKNISEINKFLNAIECDLREVLCELQ